MKKIMSLVLSCLMCLTIMLPGIAAAEIPDNAPGKLAAIEKYLYGTEQGGSLVTRVDNLESDLYGSTKEGAVLTRVENIFNEIKGTPADGGASFASKLNAVEWQFADRMSTGPAKTRIEDAEKTLTGVTHESEPLTARLNSLSSVAFPSGTIAGANAVIPKDALIKVKFLQEVSSKTGNMGDQIDFIVADNVYVGDALVIPKGAKGYGTVKKIVQPRIFGRDARIDLDFSHVVAIDGNEVPVYVGDLAKQEAKTAAGAAGAAIGGMILFGPVGVVGGAFVKGQSVTIPAGTFTYVQVKEDCPVSAIIQSGATATGVQATANADEEATK